MSESDPKDRPFDDDPIIFDPKEVMSSGQLFRRHEATEPDILDLSEFKEEEAEEEEEEELSPVMKELASVELPPLEKENRARLQMQSPNRLYFYWSMKANPFQRLSKAFGGNTGSYTLAAKLIDLTRDTEEIYPVEAEGDRWFSVDSDSSYRAEIGFYAPNRPFVRVMFSNTISTPRKRPSPRVATSADWNVSARSFARVLGVSGFSRDAFAVTLAGDVPDTPQPVNYKAFARFVELDHSDFAGMASEELRYALVLIASGLSIEHLRHRIDASLFELLLSSAEKLSAENALAALKEQFGIDTEEALEEEASSAVYGASLVSFPRRQKRNPKLPGLSDYHPVSSWR